VKTLEFKRDGACRYRIRRSGRMKVDAVFYASERLMVSLRGDECLTQLANVATLPGIMGASIGMPDMHSGYGFPIGGVAAFSLDGGVVSPGGVGYDINCGVRLVASRIPFEAARGRLDRILALLAASVPTGVGSNGPIEASDKVLSRICSDGAAWAVKNGWGEPSELERIEDQGSMEAADLAAVSARAQERGRFQVGTLGSGNHFVEVAEIAEIGYPEAARVFGLEKGNLAFLIHSGSRGFGHQICDDALRSMQHAMTRYGIRVPDRQLASAPLSSAEARSYLAAMAAAANYAFANRQVLSALVKKGIEEALAISPGEAGWTLVYDVCHNIAKIERHAAADGRKVCVHRKGATRAFPAGHPLVPAVYRNIGQPVLVPGDMGRGSFVLVATPKTLDETWGSLCHGAGRQMSRSEALKKARGRSIVEELSEKGVLVQAARNKTIAEEMPDAYKDVSEVVAAVVEAGLGRVVARLQPAAVLKG